MNGSKDRNPIFELDKHLYTNHVPIGTASTSALLIASQSVVLLAPLKLSFQQLGSTIVSLIGTEVEVKLRCILVHTVPVKQSPLNTIGTVFKLILVLYVKDIGINFLLVELSIAK